mgnify:CR=1 FL=1
MTLIHRKNKKAEKLIDLPELPITQTNPANISNLLQNGAAIWCWYKLNDYKTVKGSRYLNIPAIANMSYGFDGLTALRKSDHYLIYYKVDIGDALDIYLRPASISFFKNSNIAELCSNELVNSYKLYVDYNSDFFLDCRQYIYDINDKDFENRLIKHRSIYICKDDLKLPQKLSQKFINSDALS